MIHGRDISGLPAHEQQEKAIPPVTLAAADDTRTNSPASGCSSAGKRTAPSPDMPCMAWFNQSSVPAWRTRLTGSLSAELLGSLPSLGAIKAEFAGDPPEEKEEQA